MNYGFKKIFVIYENIVILLCLFGIIQIFLNYFDISIYQKEKWRMNSFLREPSHFGMFILPIVLKFIFEFKKLNIKLLILLFSLFWTLSVSVIFSLIISVVLFYIWKLFSPENKLFLKSKYSFFSIIVTIVFLITTFYFINFIYQNISGSGTLNVLINTETQIVFNNEIVNREYNYKQLFNNIIFNDEFYYVIQLSIHSVTSIIKVAINTLYQNPFGAGLGSNEEAFYSFKEIYVNNTFIPDSENQLIKRYNFASKSSQSLLLRMIIEFGIIFIIFLFILIIKIFKKFIFFSKEKAIIFLSLFSVIIFKTTKLGSYIDYGTGFFLISIFIILFKDNEFNRDFN